MEVSPVQTATDVLMRLFIGAFSVAVETVAVETVTVEV